MSKLLILYVEWFSAFDCRAWPSGAVSGSIARSFGTGLHHLPIYCRSEGVNSRVKSAAKLSISILFRTLIITWYIMNAEEQAKPLCSSAICSGFYIASTVRLVSQLLVLCGEVVLLLWLSRTVVWCRYWLNSLSFWHRITSSSNLSPIRGRKFEIDVHFKCVV